jgi:hypothetical protein
MGLFLCGVAVTAVRAEQSTSDADYWQKENAVVEKHRRELKDENKKFRENIKAMPKEDRTKAIEQNRLIRFRENETFRQKLHEDDMSFLKERLATTGQLTDNEKQELLAVYDVEYKENVLFLQQRNQDMMTFFEKISQDTTLTQTQKREALKSYFQQQKEEVLKQRDQQRQQHQAELQKKYSAASSSSPTSSGK